jgi:hypothetical protein
LDAAAPSCHPGVLCGVCARVLRTGGRSSGGRPGGTHGSPWWHRVDPVTFGILETVCYGESPARDVA